jgi:hypothetical protein
MINLAVNTRFQNELNNHRDLLKNWCKKTKDPFLKMCV